MNIGFDFFRFLLQFSQLFKKSIGFRLKVRIRVGFLYFLNEQEIV